MSGNNALSLADTDVLNYGQNLLSKYTANNSWWRRLLTGKWRRNHLHDAGNILNMMRVIPDSDDNLPSLKKLNDTNGSITHYPVQNSVDLLARLHRILAKPGFNKKGSLARLINKIWVSMIENPIVFIQSGIDTQLAYAHNIHREINGLALAIEHKPEYIDPILAQINHADDEQKTRLLRCALVHLMGESYYLKSWALDIPVLTNRENELVDRDFTQHIPKLLELINELPFEQKKNIILPGLIKAFSLGRKATVNQLFNELFEGYEQPSRAEIKWVGKVLLKLTPDNSHNIFNVLNNAINKGSISPPMSASSSSYQLVKSSGRYSSSLFQNLGPQDRSVIKKLNELTGQNAWRRVSGDKSPLRVELAIDREEDGLVSKITNILTRLATFGILRFRKKNRSEQVSFQCSNIDLLQLHVSRPAEEATPEFNHELRIR